MKTTTHNKRRTYFKNSGLCVLLLIALTSISPRLSPAATIISGNVSGVWPPTGNPYLIADTAIIPSSQTLTIEPGVDIIVGSNIQFMVEGTMLAVGTRALPIRFHGASPSNYWMNLRLNWNPGNAKSRFVNCQFSDAQTGIRMIIETVDGQKSMEVDVLDTSFTNILGPCVYGRSLGQAHWVGGVSGGIGLGFPNLKPMINGCRFSGAPIGCYFVSYGEYYSNPGGSTVYSHGTVNPNIANCYFSKMTNAAIAFDQTQYSDPATPTIHNNIIVGSTNGIMINRLSGGVANVSPEVNNNVFYRNHQAVSLSDFSDATVQNNIFVANSNGIVRTGSLASRVEYNCFNNNLRHFVGYPASYGQMILFNQNGTPCDMLMNIIQDPILEDTNSFRLLPTSPCVDAGSPKKHLRDGCFPPSLGTGINDQGAYGGLEACNWLEVTPKVPAELEISIISKTNVNLKWNAIPRSEYQIVYNTNLVTTNWHSLSNGWKRIELVTNAITITKSPLKTNLFYRIKSLGRTPGY